MIYKEYVKLETNSQDLIDKLLAHAQSDTYIELRGIDFRIVSWSADMPNNATYEFLLVNPARVY